jgi:hypothetical protein
MALQSNGQLLIRVRGDTRKPLIIRGYTFEPLSSAPQAISDHWQLARPDTWKPDPWDAAHAAAGAHGYAHYVEPDILHKGNLRPPGTLEGGLDPNWPPDPHDAVSPGWHLEPEFTGFESVRASATGRGVRIAHLDTGYTPGHLSKPRNLRPDLGYDYWDKKADPIDPGTEFLGYQPGHGTATLALLAGNTLDLSFGTRRFQGDFGGAPDAEVIPVRISPTVIHIYTSTMARGLYHALAPGGNTANRCDVVSISHGGLPAVSWADAVNALYEAGTVIVL